MLSSRGRVSDVVIKREGVGGGSVNFSSNIGSAPAATSPPPPPAPTKTISDIPQNYLKFSISKNNYPILYIDPKNNPENIEMTTQNKP